MAAGKAIFSLKSDQASLQERYTTQDHHLNIIMSSLAEEITGAKAAIHSIAHEMPLAAEEMSVKVDHIQENLARLISTSQDYGKLKVSLVLHVDHLLLSIQFEESLSKQLEILMIYSEGLVRARESIAREIKEINENLDDDDTLVMAIAKRQEERLTKDLSDNPEAEDSAEKSETVMKRLSSSLLSRRESGQVSGISQEKAPGPRSRRVTFSR